MRWIAAVMLLAGLVGTAVPVAAQETGVLTLNSFVAARKGGTLRFSFDSSNDPTARDLSQTPISVVVASDAPLECAVGTKGLKIDKYGLVAKFHAPKKLKTRVRQFVLLGQGGSFELKLAGAALDPLALPGIELSFGATSYVFGQVAPTAPPDSGSGGGTTNVPPSLPDGAVAFTSLFRNVVSPNSPVGAAVLRSQNDLSNYLSALAEAPTLPSVDFSKEMVLVVAGDQVGGEFAPDSVRVHDVTSSGGAISVWYDKPYGPVLAADNPNPPPITQPPFTAWVNFVKIPITSAPVSFHATVYYSQTPWQ